MAHRKYDLVQETSTSTGTGNIALAGAVTRRRAFSAVLSNADTCYVLIENASAAEWEICLATYVSAGNQLSRGAVLASSTGSAVSFTAGTKTISLVAPAANSVVEDNAGNVTIGGAAFVGSSVESGGDFYLTRTSNAYGYVLRPNTVGYKKLAFAVAGGGQLEEIYANAQEFVLLTGANGNIKLVRTSTAPNYNTISLNSSTGASNIGMQGGGGGDGNLYLQATNAVYIQNSGGNVANFTTTGGLILGSTLYVAGLMYGTGGSLAAPAASQWTALQTNVSDGNADTFEQLFVRTANSPTSWTTVEAVLRRNVDGTAAQGAITFTGGGGLRLAAGAYTNAHLVIEPASVQVGTTFYPSADNTYALGGGGNRWSVVYAGTGTINTSGRDAKVGIRAPSDAERRAAQRILAIGPKLYKFKDAVDAKGDAARLHAGYIAEDVRDALEAEGLDPWAYGFMCADPQTTTESYVVTIERAKVRRITSTEQAVEMRDGRAVLISREVERDEKVGSVVEVYDENGAPVLVARGPIGKDGTPSLVPMTHFVPETETVEETRTREVPLLDTAGNPVMRLGLRYSELEAFLKCAA